MQCIGVHATMNSFFNSTYYLSEIAPRGWQSASEANARHLNSSHLRTMLMLTCMPAHCTGFIPVQFIPVQFIPVQFIPVQFILLGAARRCCNSCNLCISGHPNLLRFH